ncbi:MmcQ/YjbR family DNA-binding protein [Kribbella sp. DT2]|uniref:MmcQ/YjbR family DNA-binding protein n=1 Tax=Kribbella sp. DT2 TaxID=3393427 RepID=UPI003CF65DBF
MADQDAVRCLALELPEVTENDDRFAFSIGKKAIAWVWLERSAPKAPRVPNPAVLASAWPVSPASSSPIPHYNGYPAILVHLNAVDEAELRELLIDAWRIQAPKSLVKQHPDL